MLDKRDGNRKSVNVDTCILLHITTYPFAYNHKVIVLVIAVLLINNPLGCKQTNQMEVNTTLETQMLHTQR